MTPAPEPEGWPEARSALAREIEAAFDGVPRGEITLHEAEAIDVWHTPPDDIRAEARAHDTEPRWQDVPDAWIEACTDASYHVDPVSWRYYLPRWLLWSLDHQFDDRNEDFLHTSILYGLTLTDPDADPTSVGYLEHSHLARIRDSQLASFATLDPAQARAIRRFLETIMNLGINDHDDFLKALDRYWNRAGSSDPRAEP